MKGASASTGAAAHGRLVAARGEHCRKAVGIADGTERGDGGLASEGVVVAGRDGGQGGDDGRCRRPDGLAEGPRGRFHHGDVRILQLPDECVGDVGRRGAAAGLQGGSNVGGAATDGGVVVGHGSMPGPGGVAGRRGADERGSRRGSDGRGRIRGGRSRLAQVRQGEESGVSECRDPGRAIDPVGVHRRRTYSVRSWEPTTRQ